MRGAVDERDPQPLALAAAQRRAGDAAVVGPGRELHAGRDLDLLVDRVQLPLAQHAPARPAASWCPSRSRAGSRAGRSRWRAWAAGPPVRWGRGRANGVGGAALPPRLLLTGVGGGGVWRRGPPRWWRQGARRGAAWGWGVLQRQEGECLKKFKFVEAPRRTDAAISAGFSGLGNAPGGRRVARAREAAVATPGNSCASLAFHGPPWPNTPVHAAGWRRVRARLEGDHQEDARMLIAGRPDRRRSRASPHSTLRGATWRW